MAKLFSMKLIGVKGVRKHIMEIRDIAAQLKSLEVEISNSFLVHLILNSLPPQYGLFKISYNTHKDKWSINELLTMCVQEEGRLAQEIGEGALTVTQDQSQWKKNEDKGKKDIPAIAKIKKESRCFFCKKKGHMKKDCYKCKAWLGKKSFVSQKVPMKSERFIYSETGCVRMWQLLAHVDLF